MKRELAGIQYLGISGVTHRCKDAIINLIQNDESIQKARLLTSLNTHCFVLMLDWSKNIVQGKTYDK